MSYSNRGKSRTELDCSSVPDAALVGAEGLIRHIARKFIDPGSGLWDDVVQEGRIGLCKALASHPGSLDGRLTWAVPWIVGEIRDYLGGDANLIRVPVMNGGGRAAILAEVNNILSIDADPHDDREFGVGTCDVDIEFELALQELPALERSVIMITLGGWSFKEQTRILGRSYCDIVTAMGRGAAAMVELLELPSLEERFPRRKVCPTCHRELDIDQFARINGGWLVESACRKCKSRRVIARQKITRGKGVRAA